MASHLSPPAQQHAIPQQSNGGPPSAAARRICRQLVVEASTTEKGLHVQLVCKVVLPTSADNNSESIHLLRNVPLAKLVAGETYPLPLFASDPASALEAARKLGIQPPPAPFDNSEEAAGSEGKRPIPTRRRSSAASSRSLCLRGMGRAPLRVEEEGDEIVLRRGPATLTAATPGAGASSDAARGSSSVSANLSHEYLLVLHFDLSAGRLRLPLFANSIVIPTPLCLRNTLTLTLPSPPAGSAFSAWDLSVRPSLSNAASLLHTSADSESTQITGNFPSTPSLSLRWGPQLPTGSEAQLVIPHAILSTAWQLEPSRPARAQVDVQGTFEYAGLREKQWVEVEVGASSSAIEVQDCTGVGGTAVLDWHVAAVSEKTADSTTLTHPPNPASPDLSLVKPVSRKTSASSLGLGVPSSASLLATPSARRRRSSNRPVEARPPSFHSLFDTAMPAPPVLDTSFVTEMQMSSSDLLDTSRRHASGTSSRKEAGSSTAPTELGEEPEPSLLKQAAPFDPEASALDMSFEVGSLPDSTHSDSEAGDTLAPAAAAAAGAEAVHSAEPLAAPPPPSVTTVRIQLDLGPALRAFAVNELADRPTFAFRLSFCGAAITATGENAPVQLPPVRFSSAVAEDGVVTVSPQSGLTLDVTNDDDAILRLSDGRLRWTTSRTDLSPDVALPAPVSVALRPQTGSVDPSPQLAAVVERQTGTDEIPPLLDETEVSFAESLDADADGDASFATVMPGSDERQMEDDKALEVNQPPVSSPEAGPHPVDADSPTALGISERAFDRRSLIEEPSTAAAPVMDTSPATMRDGETQTPDSPPSLDVALAIAKRDSKGSVVQTLPLPAPRYKGSNRSRSSRDDSLVKSLTRLLMLVTLTLIATQGWHYLRGGHPSPFARYRSRHASKYPLLRQHPHQQQARAPGTVVSFDTKTTTVTRTIFSTETHVATITSVSTRTEHRTITSLHSLTTTVTSTPTTSPRPLPIYSDDFTAAAPATPSSTVVSPHGRKDSTALSPNEAKTVAAQFMVWLHTSMHAFWQSANAALHACLLDHLAEDTVISLLPLLAVNRRLRTLGIARLVAAYAKNSSFAPSYADDPRHAIATPRDAFIPSHRPPLDFHLDSFDPDTLLCTLKPTDPKAFLRWATCCAYEAHDAPLISLMPASFMITPSAWFRQARPDETEHVAGLVLAAKPTSFPLLYPVFYPEVPDKPGAMIQSFDEYLPNGWLISYRAKRLDMIKDLGTTPEAVWLHGTCRTCIISVPSYCKVFSLKVPLLDLFRPRDASSECPWRR
ncbi:hypothetical protein JCM10908_000840 [Rhodotorula pacifica]|uniref:uncharacterized protein n=1 Tax=Rhodotorula pacifica TaxID=1495444 RepID=UPI0031796869